jgi:tetratricopeptide (TPR) repeat protein
MPGSWKTVRVFISSPFRDMQAERDDLVKVVFPALRERLERYRVHLIDIDLRWGVTREQAENRQILGLCLRQVDDCRPFFLGLLGQRYGWVPDRLPADAVRRHPWLSDHAGTSITELEMLHGALRDPHGGALFCFRDPEAVRDIPEPLRSAVFVETDPIAGGRLAALKDHIRRSGCAVLDPYPCRWDPEEPDRPSGSRERLTGLGTFGDWVRDRLWEAIASTLRLPADPPAASAGDPDAEESEAHERFLESRLRVYAGREDVRRTLLAFVRGPESVPCVVTGPPGIGKSAVLARFAADCRREYPEALVVPHFVGAGPRSTGLRDLLRRLCRELARRFGLDDDLPEETHRLGAAFQELLWKVPPGAEVVLVLDALDRLDETGQAHGLHWLPEQLPRGVKVVAGCTSEDGEPAPVLEALARRPHQVVCLGPLRAGERRRLLRDVPSLSAKTLDAGQIAALLDNPATGNPLFLLVALEELRGFGSFERLSARIAALPREGDALTALFTQVIERLEEEFDRSLVRAVLEALASARRGLAERELQDLTAAAAGAGDLFPVLRQLRPYLLTRAGLVDFAHLDLARAVRRRYLAAEESRWAGHRRLADYFAWRGPGPRQVEELPWQLTRAGEWGRLARLLADLPFFDAAWQAGPEEVKAYWARVEAETPARPQDAYGDVAAAPAEHDAETVGRVATLLADTGRPAAALALRRHLADHHRRTGDRARLAVVLGHLASVLKGRGDLDGALTLLREAEQICRELGNRHGIQTALGNQARILKERGALDGAMALLRQAETICRELGNRHGLQIILGNQALVLLSRGDPDGALALLRERERLCRELGNRHGLQVALSNQALVLLGRGDLDGAMDLLRRAEAICRELGNRHGLQIALGHQARVLTERGDLDAAMDLLREQERLCRELGNPLGLQIAVSNEALVLQRRGRVEEALALLREAERLSRDLGNPEGLAIVLLRQAELLAGPAGRLDEALGPAEEANRIAVGHGLAALVEQVGPVLEALERARRRKEAASPGSFVRFPPDSTMK